MTTETDNEKLIPISRDIHILLSLSTYQGMTDDEIDKLIEYKIHDALMNAELEKMREQNIANISSDLRLGREALLESERALANTLSSDIPWATIDSEGRITQNA